MAGSIISGTLNEELLETSNTMRQLACHRITAFPGKLKGVTHSQEDGINLLFSYFITNINNFIKFSKIVQSSTKTFCCFMVIMPI